MLKVTQQIGALTVEVAGEQPKDIIQQLAFFGTLPGLCPFPVDAETTCDFLLQLTFKVVVPQSGEHKGKTLKYYGMRCANTPAHECNFGQRADDGSIFYKGANSFQMEYKAREAMESGQHSDHPIQTRQDTQARDSFNARDDSPQQNGGGEQPRQGPTSGQRTYMTKLLTDAHITLNDAYEMTKATKNFEEMPPAVAAKFITAVELELGVKK